ncbi:MAG: beta-galactosidase GalB [Puniceicoccaceae bacterium]
MKRFSMGTAVSSILLLFVSAVLSAQEFHVPDLEFNDGWLFHKGKAESAEDAGFDDSGWRKVTLPHDWAIEGPFSNKHNARTGGLPVTGTGWYRKHFDIPVEWKRKRISIEFDGAMSDAHVWVNGKFIGNRPYGYIGFEFDITEAIKFGEENVIAVRLSPKDLAMRWYPGAGLYRNVRLKANHLIRIPQYGTFITTPVVTEKESVVNVETTIKCDCPQDREGNLVTTIVGPCGEVVAEDSVPLEIVHGTSMELQQNFVVENPVLWDIGQPNLYKAISKVFVHEVLVDVYETEFGIRSIDFDADKGFIINGRVVELNGACMHHDLGPLGAAVNYRASERQMQIMQSMGLNALRTSHNPPSPEMLQVCDRLGIVAIVEAFDEWKTGKVPNGYNIWFDEWHEADLRDMVRRDRNHPSVIMWSLGNEILEQAQKDGWKLTKHLNDIVKDEDLTRPTTAGFNYFPHPFENKLAFYIDVVGMNYWPHSYKKLKEKYPDMIIYGSETSSQTSSRGVYHLPLSPDVDPDKNHVSSYDVITGPPWAYAPDAEFAVQEENPFSLGEFIWTGFDYLGEPTPYGGRDNSTNGYWNDDWPSRSSYFAPVDLCGFPKDRYYLYQSQWTTEPMVHVLPHWNWKGREGEKIPVFSYTNCDEVELFVNGKSYGRKVKGVDTTTFLVDYYDYGRNPFESKYRLSWEVPYKPGELKVVGYKNGKAVAKKSIRTAGKPARIELIADRDNLNADGKDLSFVTVRILDAAGNLCPMADNLVKFTVEGEGKLEAVGNGDQASLAPFTADEREAFSGMCLAIIKAGDAGGTIRLKAESKGLETAFVSIINN